MEVNINPGLYSRMDLTMISVVEHFGELYHVTLQKNQTLYALPVGEIRPYFSFNRLARRISEAHVSDSPVVRHTSVANKWKTIHLLLHPGHNATQIHYNLTLQREDDTEFAMSFSVAVDTREVPQANASKAMSKESGKEPTVAAPTPETEFPFWDIPEDKRGPKIRQRQPAEADAVVQVPSLNVSLLPAAVRGELQKLEEKLLIGDITVKGYNLTKAQLLKDFKMPAEEQQPGRAQEKPDKEQPDGNEQHPHKDRLTTPFIPVHIDDKQKKEESEVDKPPHLKAVIERPMTSKLLSSITQKRSTEHHAVGRRLQHFTSSDRGFLPWERRKYFQALLEVVDHHLSTTL